MAELETSPALSKVMIFARRTISTLFLWGLVTSIFLSGSAWGVLGLIGVLTMIAMVEYFRMLKSAGVMSFPKLGIIVAVGYCFFLYRGFLNGKNEIPFLIDAAAIFICLAGAFTLQLRCPIRGLESLSSVALGVFGFIYIPFLFNFTARITFIVSGATVVPGTVGSHGMFLLLWLLAVTKFTDMGAYIVGSIIGRHKMIPHVSPGKTWEGFGGALLFSQIAACGLYLLFPEQLSFFRNWTNVIFLGFILAICAVVGDLAESVVKRALNAKDSGKMLPGIGGSLDLIDSICFTAPALYFYLKWIILSQA
jgi:phosphatidate cytidylyltransferase